MLPVVKRAFPQGRKGFVHWYNVAVPRRSGGIGRRAGLKIRWVQARVGSSPTSGTAKKYLQIAHFSYRQRKALGYRSEGFGSNAAAIGYERAASIAGAAWSRMFGSTWE